MLHGVSLGSVAYVLIEVEVELHALLSGLSPVIEEADVVWVAL